MKKIFLTFVLLLFVAGCSQYNDYPVQVTWTAPEGGVPIDHYLVELSEGGCWKLFQSEQTNIKLNFEYDVPCYVRVAAVSPAGQTGPYSPNSDVLLIPKP